MTHHKPPLSNSGGRRKREWERLSDLLGELEHLAARQAASDAVLTEVIVPLLVSFSPDLAQELIDGIRAGFNISTLHRSERLQLLTEEYLARLADGIEARVRAKMDGR
ncbi:hypothetical protein ABIA85_006665 [Bradyrhizobium sp. LA6.10]|uniref:hypothetical protein n=1 Tax=Bradyrhizobium sp. LA6.10 TaxID=3156318 RepID=UPI0033958BD0